MKIVVTGANGFLGCNLVNRLVADGYDVVASDLTFNNPNLVSSSNYKTQEADICNFSETSSLLEGATHVYHCAGLISYDPSEEEMLFQVNHQGTRNVLRASIDQGIEKLLHVSSTAAIGTQPFSTVRKNKFLPSTEHTQKDDLFYRMPYGLSKYLGEEAVMEFVKHEDLNATVICPCTIVGRGDFGKKSQEGAVDVILGKNLRFSFPGRLSVVDVNDVVEGALIAMEKGGKGEKYILSGDKTSVWEYVASIKKNSGKRSKVFALPFWTHYPLKTVISFLEDLGVELPKGLGSNLLTILYRSRLFDSTKARQELGWEPRFSLDASIKEAVAFHYSLDI